MKKIVSIGRGGVGKTVFISLLAKYLKDRGPILLIDSDPDESLAEMLGIDLEKEKIKTISEILFDLRFGSTQKNLDSFSLSEKIEYLFHQNGIYEGKFFDLISLGVKWTEGCYCQPNNILKNIIKELEGNYEYVLIDSPAGLEHLNRRITSQVDIIFAILDASKKAIENLKRSQRIISEVKIVFKDFFVIANHRFPEDLVDSVEREIGFNFLGKLDYDENIEEFNRKGISLFELEDSPAFFSLKKILEKVNL
jgi:CO dehydrogenase maturation factor